MSSIIIDEDTPIPGENVNSSAPKSTVESATPKEGTWDKLKKYFETGSQGEAAIRGLTEGATFGLGNKAQAAIRAMSPIQIEPNSEGTGPSIGFNQDYGDYSKLKAEGEAANAAAAASHPIEYGVGQVAGSIPGALVTGAGGVNAVKNVGALGNLTRNISSPLARAAVGAGVPGATIGAMQGAGAPDTGYVDRTLNTLKGGAVGGTLSALGGAAGQVIAPVAKAAAPVINRPTMGLHAQLKTSAERAAEQAAIDAARSEGVSKGIQVAIPGGTGALGVIAPGILPGTEKVDTNKPVVSQAIGHARNALVGGALGTIPKMSRSMPHLGGAVGSTISNYLNNTQDNIVPQQSAPASNEPVVPLTPDEIKYFKDDSVSKADTPSNQFATVADYLKQASKSENPIVQEIAKKAQSAQEGADSDTKRKIAMALQSTPEGRGVGNSTSPINEQS